MGRVLTMDKTTTIETLLRQGQGIRAICRMVRSAPKVVIRLRDALRDRETPTSEVPTGSEGERETVQAQVPTGESLSPALSPLDSWGYEEQEESPDVGGQELTTRSTQLRPHLAMISHLIDRGLEARLIWQELVDAHSFRGAEDSVKRLVRKARARRPKWFQHLAVLPGQEAQMDFMEGPKIWKGDGRGKSDTRRSWIMVLTLSHSGKSYREVIGNQSARTVIEALMRGFEKFGGVPEWLKIDNFKAAVTQAHRYDPILNPLFQAWASHYGIVLSPCDPGKPNQKGRVERDCRYTRDSFVKALTETVTFDDLNQKLGSWSRKVADQRIHGRHKRQVQEVFASEEKPALRPLPDRPFLVFEMGRRKVSVHGAVEVEGCHYEVSHRLISTTVEVRYDSKEVRVYRTDERQAPVFLVRHDRCWKKGTLVGAVGTHPAWMDKSRQDREAHYIQAARKQIGPHCEAVVGAILSNDRGHHPRVHRMVQGIRSLAKRFGADALEQACARTTPHPEVNWHHLQELCEMIRAKADDPSRPKSSSETECHEALTMNRIMTDPVIRPLSEYDDLLEGMASVSEVAP
jgi:transposase